MSTAPETLLESRKTQARAWFEALQGRIIAALEAIEDECTGPFDPEAAAVFAASDDWGQLWMVDNPPHNPQGDFVLDEEGRIQRRTADGPAGLTYSTIGLYRPAMVEGIAVGEKAALRPCLERAIDAGRLSGQHHGGPWVDVGTPERLALLNQTH